MKQTIIFLHGGPGFQDYLKPYFENISDINCIFYNQLQGANIKLDDLLNQLDEHVTKSPTKPIICGHSWGAVLGTKYVLENKEKISGLVTMCTGMNSEQWTLYNKELEEKGIEDISRDKLFFTDVELKAGIEMFESDSWNGFSEETFDSIFDSFLESYDLLTKLNDIAIPFLNIFGEKDLRFSKHVTTTFRKYNHRIVDLEIKDSGHFPFLLKKNRVSIIAEIKALITSQEE